MEKEKEKVNQEYKKALGVLHQCIEQCNGLGVFKQFAQLDAVRGALGTLEKVIIENARLTLELEQCKKDRGQ